MVGLHLTVVVSSRLTYTAFQRFMSSITPRFGHFSTEKRRPQSQNCPKLTKRERETPLNRARQADHGLMGSYQTMKAKKHLNLRIPLWWPSSHGWRRLVRALTPHPGTLIVTLLVVAGLIWANSVGALPLRAPAAASTSTGTIAYQGRLADADGNPLTDTYNMVFRLYDVASGGVFLWGEQWTGSNGVQVSDGLFNVMLGSLTPIPQSVITEHESLFLGITVGTDDEMTPRVQLGSVPFAVQALTVPDGSVTTEKIADEAVTQAKLGADVSLVPPDGSITTEKLADDAVTSSKIAHQFGASSQPLLNFVPRQSDSWDYIYSGTAGAYWREVDISSIVPAEAVAVLIRVSYAQAAAPLSQLYIRHKDGTSRAEGALVNSSRQDISADYGAQRIIYLPGSVKKLEEKTNTHSAQHGIQIAVIGWWEPAHQ